MESAALELINSDRNDHRGTGCPEDRLQLDSWLQSFLARWGFQAAGPPGAATRASLTDLRSLLRRMAEAVAGGGAPSPGDLGRLDLVLAGGPARRRLIQRREGLDLVWTPVERDWNWVLAELAASFAALLARDPSRIKLCANADCGWIFYDRSRNRSRRWCESTCASLIKVRRFRARRSTRGA